MGSSATTGVLLYSLLLLSTLVCCTHAAGILGFENDGTSSLVEILKKDVCCARRFRTKTIEQSYVQNNIRYNCKATVRQAYCGGNCKVDSTYMSGIMQYNRFFRPTGWADKPSATVTNTYCRINTSVIQTYKMRCRAEKGCCQDVSQEEITIAVQVTEPASGDNGCTCEKIDVATPFNGCALRHNYQYVYFTAWPWRCRSFSPIYLPYCSGHCNAYEDFYFALAPFYRRVNRKYCTCCGSSGRYAAKKIGVYCWNLFPFEDLEKENISAEDREGNRIDVDKYNSVGFKFDSITIHYIRDCSCNYQNCQEDSQKCQ